MDNNNFFEGLTWEDNSKLMYDSILNEIPAFLRAGIYSSIKNWLLKNDISVVTEDVIFKAVNDIAPSNIANNMILPKLEKLKSKE